MRRARRARRAARRPLPSLAACLALLALPACGDDGGAGPGVAVSVFTRNLYLGSDLFPLATVPSPDAVPATAAALWANVQASDFPARAAVLAAEIVALAPDLVALQEVTHYRTQTPGDYQPGDATPNATQTAIDFLALLMAEIDARGGGYRVAGEALNADAELPVADAGMGPFDLRVTDRDVILARTGVETSDFVATPFTAKFMLTVGGTGGVPVAFTRGFSRLRAVVGGAPFVFANSHLEVQILATVQMQQAQQMLDGLAPMGGPLLLLGDFNSAPGMNSYPAITAMYRDGWVDAGGSDPGFTCCQDGDLRNATSSADQRIDLVLHRGPVRVTGIRVTGSDPATDRTPGGLWPSDHLGVFATVEIGR